MSVGTHLAGVQVWAKGFRVSQDSEEFQRVVPCEAPSSVMEQRFEAVGWGRVLEPLYGLSAKEVASQRCVLVSSNEFGVACLAKSEDKYRRPSLVLVTVSTHLSWGDDGLGSTVARGVSLATRLSAAYSEAFKRNPESVARQLASGHFLESRMFQLEHEEAANDALDWDAIMRGVKAWRGVSGVATTRLLECGANVLLGTRHEAEMAQSRGEVDGYYDIREKRIVSLGTKLTPWRALVPETAPAPTVDDSFAQRERERLDQLVSSVNRMEGTLARVADALMDLLQFVRRDEKRRRR